VSVATLGRRLPAVARGVRVPALTRRLTDRAGPRWIIAAHTMRRALRWAAVWGVVFGLVEMSSITAFVAGYPTMAERLKLAQSLQSFSALLGWPYHAETIAGFVTWRILVIVVTIGAIWGLLTSTGLLRGEEDAGRWELLLTGQTTRRWATVQALVGLGGALLVMFVLVALLTLAAGRTPGARFPLGGSLLFALAAVSGAAMFVSIGALTSQLSATRGQAAMIAAALLGVSFAIRMVADSRRSFGWIRWLSPIGWAEELRPLRDPQPWALIPIVALVGACAVLAVVLAGRRDLNAGVLREREARGGDPRWLVGPITLTLRLSRSTMLAWLGGIALASLMYGSIARSTVGVLNGSPTIAATLGRLGVRLAVQGYLGIVFMTMAIVIALLAASQIAAIRDEEAAGRLDHLLVRPVRRTRWLGGRLAVSAGLVLVAGLVAGVFCWVGVAGQHTGVMLPTLLAAGLNATMPGLFVLGAGGLVFGLRPRLSAAVAYGIVAWSFLAYLLGSLIKGTDLVRQSSLLAHMALAPSKNPEWGTWAVVVLLGAAAAVAGAAAFERRDVEYE
jgi:ABC-2 type transport system permease protein